MNTLTEYRKSWNGKIASLKANLPQEDLFESEKKKLLEIHSLFHEKSVGKHDHDTYYDLLWENLNESVCRIMSKKETSIAWNIWHITRIEDMIANILMAGKDEIFNEEIQDKLGITMKDTGNAMTASEIELFDSQINLKALKQYRKKVGTSTQKILAKLEHSDLKRKVKQEDIEKIRLSGGVSSNEKAIWLLDFWGRKNMMGLISMPITRHQIVHINDCFIIKERYNKD